MNYRSCEALNTNFIVTESGDIACPAAEMIVNNSMQRAYIFTNLFFYDITQREIKKLTDKIAVKKQAIIDGSGVAADDVDALYPRLSSQFKLEVGDNSLDPLIKLTLGQETKRMTMALSKEEKKELDAMYDAICLTEIQKFRKAVIFTQDNKGKPYEVNFSEKYINNLPPRCQRLLKPTIKMLAYMDGLQFATFNLSDTYQLTYTWADERPNFNEQKIKDDIKSVIAGEADDDV